jgi:hypothetical protein
VKRYLITLSVFAFLMSCGDPPLSDPDVTEDVDANEIPCVENVDCSGVYEDLAPCEEAICTEKFCGRVWLEVDAVCDDGSPCSTGDRCVENVDGKLGCLPTLAGCDDGNACTKNDCGEEGCEVSFLDGDVCDDGDVCTESGTCQAGECQSGAPIICTDDENPCTDDVCDSGSGCVNTNNTAPCNDDDLCTHTDACSGGACGGAAYTCTAGDSTCQTSTCDGEGACVVLTSSGFCVNNGVCYADGAANPNNSCEICDLSFSNSFWSAGTNGDACDDGNACTEEDTCLFGQCNSGSEKVCDDVNSCTDDSCDSGSGCTFVDNDDFCNTATGCSVSGQCSAGACVDQQANDCTKLCEVSGNAGDEVSCLLGLASVNSGEPFATSLALTIGYDPAEVALYTLTDTNCELNFTCLKTNIPQGGSTLEPSGHDVLFLPSTQDDWSGSVTVSISHFTDASKAINDGTYENDDPQGDTGLVEVKFTLASNVSNAGIFLHSLSAEADGQPLTVKLVDDVLVTSLTSCGGDICFDGAVCTTDTCNNGTCDYGLGSGQCDDGDPCTVGDSCDGNGDCVSSGLAAAGTACKGENLCTDVGQCDSSGACVYQASMAVSCTSDDSDCYSSSCEPATGHCITTLKSGAWCDDSNACTYADTCNDQGFCKGESKTCDDGVNCTDDGCDDTTGCTTTLNDSVCNDDNPCTIDSCTNTGCSNAAAVGSSCNDGDECSDNDACTAAATCEGSKNDKCGCESNVDCAVFDDSDDLCSGTYACVQGADGGPSSCVLDQSTVVSSCPDDGFLCKKQWACNPATGKCEGTLLECDDGVDCTDDYCDFTQAACVFQPSSSCPIGSLCELTGNAGDEVQCAVNLIRSGLNEPKPTSADFEFVWPSGSLEALGVVGPEVCWFPTWCTSKQFVDCSTGTCKWSNFASNHKFIVEPSQLSDWDDGMSFLTFHFSDFNALMNDAYVNNGVIVGDPLLYFIKFKLNQNASVENPIKVEVTGVSISPSSGNIMDVVVDTVGDTTGLVVTGQ